MSITSTLIDNSPDFTLLEKIKEILSDTNITSIDIATGYWDIPGVALLAQYLDAFLRREGTKLRLLIGSDPYLMAKYNREPKYKDWKFPEDFIRTEIHEIDVKSDYENAVRFLLSYLETDKMEIRIFKKDEQGNAQFLHSKCWIFYGKDNSYGIIGSSNFTEKGLSGNSELNYLEVNPFVVKYPKNGKLKGHIAWFEEKWNLSEDWTKVFLEQILRPSKIAKAAAEEMQTDGKPVVLSPYECYIKLLIDQFDQIINFDGKITPDDYMPHDKSFKRLSYQAEAVNQGLAILKEHGGFILADVVGLGKTFTALMVAKRHLLETGFKRPVLIITPPAIRQSWIDSIAYFDKDEAPEKHLKPHVTLTTIGCIDDVCAQDEYIAENDFDSAFKKDDYGMIILDESRRFRNDGTIMYQKLDDLIGSIVPQPYIVLLSATPQNNAPYDLRNQIYLFQREHNNSTLQNLGEFGNKLENYFAQKQKNYEQCIKKDKTVNGKKVPKTKEELDSDRATLIADSEDIRKRIVEPLVIRRTRTDIEKFYADDMKSQNLHFPKIQKPVAIPYEMGGELGKLFNDTINIIAPQVSHVDADEEGQPVLDFGSTAGEDALGYYRYRAIEFLKTEENRKKHEANNLTVSGTSERLAQIMELLLVKRLESSQAAFKESLHNLRRYTENMIRMWEADRIFVCPDIDVNKELSDEAIAKNGTFESCLDVIARKAKKANRRKSGDENEGVNQEYKRTDFFENYIEKLSNDIRLIDALCDSWDKQTSDPKMSTFIFKTASDFLNPARNKNKKLVIFTECIATQKALVQKLQEMPIPDCKVLSVTAKNRAELKDVIAENFDANFNGTQKDDYQILITTDVLAEGVNLHRANSILNYDSPWNATRLMQRLGRINRIGTDAKKIWNYNFYPSTLGDEQINLKNRTFVKLQAFHELFGEDSQIYSTEEKVKHFDKVPHEEFGDTESPIMPFISELREFKKNNGAEYERLANITAPVVSYAKQSHGTAFANVHEFDADHNLIHNMLYISGRGAKPENTAKAGQLEFFEKLKPLAEAARHSEQSGVAREKSLIENYKNAILIKYEADKQNAELSLKAKNAQGKKERERAFEKMQGLLKSHDDLSDECYALIDDICDAISASNAMLIKKVNECVFEDSGLGLLSVEAAVQGLHRYTQCKKTKTVPEVQVLFIG